MSAKPVLAYTRTFEETFVPPRMRIQAAARNLAYTAVKAAGASTDILERIVNIHPWFEVASRPLLRVVEREFRPQFPVLTLLLPGGCQFRCDGCGANASSWRKHPEHFTFEEVRPALDALRSMGLRLIRVVGEGEPTIAPSFLPLVEWADRNEVALVVCTNGILPTVEKRREEILRAFEQSRTLHFLVKMLSDNQEEQESIVQPQGRLRADFVEHERLGLVPTSLATFWNIAPTRVGRRITVYRGLEDSVRRVLRNGGQRNLPTFVGGAEEVGEGGVFEGDLLPDLGEDIQETQFLRHPPWPPWCLAITSFGELVPALRSDTERPRGLPVVGDVDIERTLKSLLRLERDGFDRSLISDRAPLLL